VPAAVNDLPAKINASRNLGGSRFDVLNVDSDETNMETNVEPDGEFLDSEETRREPILELRDNKEEAINRKKQNKNKRGTGGDPVAKFNVAERIPKEPKLATRVGNTFKGKVGANTKKGVEHAMDKMGIDIIGDLMGQTVQPKAVSTQNITGRKNIGEHELGLTSASMLGPKSVSNPNLPRPPDNVVIPPISQKIPTLLTSNEDLAIEGEVFEDANDQGSNLSSDSDMEVVGETPNLA
jgi:hypothetical protein